MKAPARILVIDDNEAIHNDFRKILEARSSHETSDDFDEFFEEVETSQEDPATTSYELAFASQGQAGLAEVERAISENRPFALAFVDMRMPPGWDGIETIKHLWKADPNLEIVICSAHSDYSWSDIADELGISSRLLILKKPFDSVEVLQAAASLTRKYELERENAIYRTDLEQRVQENTQALQETLIQLTESEQFLNASLDSMTAQVAILDKDGRICLHNRAWASAGSPFVTDASVKSANYLDECESRSGEVAPTSQLIANTIRELVAGSRDTFLHEYEHVDEASWFTVRLTRFVDKGSVYVVVLHEDITEHKLIQVQLGQAQKLESVGQLAAGIAHEINTPMQYIGDNLEYMSAKFDKLLQFLDFATQLAEESGATSPDFSSRLQGQIKAGKLERLRKRLPDAIRDSQEGTQHVSRIVRAMKELSHLGDETKKEVDVNRVLETTRTVSTNEWKYVADVEMELDPNLQSIEGLQGELNQVFLNLFVNSAHAISDVTDAGNNGRGTITVRTKQLEGSVRVEIADTGGGIPDKVKNRVFDPFFTTKEVGKGTGQGLAIAHSVVTGKHGGRIHFEVEKGVGTTFIIELPIKAENETLEPELVNGQEER